LADLLHAARKRPSALPAGLPEGLLLALPGLATVYLSFQGGGFFAGAPAVAAAAVALVLLLRTTLSERPFAGLSPGLFAASGTLAVLAVWTLGSALWSDSPSRALVETDRVLLYLLMLVLFGSLAPGKRRAAWLVRGLAVCFGGVAIVAFLTRALPDVLPVAENLANERLSFPLSYWNALGLLATLSMILSLHLASSDQEPRGWRVLGAAMLPPVAATLVLTFSRGAIAVAVVALPIYLIAARPRGAIAALLTAIPTTAIAVVLTLDADALAQVDPTTDAAVAQGGDLALAVLGLALVAAVARALLLPLDRRIAKATIGAAGRRAVLGLVAVGMVLAVVAAVALDVPGYAGRQFDRFVEGASVDRPDQPRDRLFDPGNNGRLDQWQVALDSFSREPLHGTGAGTYGTEWAREREIPLKVEDAHSLYIEMLAELGIVGLLAVVITVGLILGAFALRLRQTRSHVYAALLAAGVAWAMHAGIDWDWEMPAVTLWLFAAGGLALAGRRERTGSPPRLLRVIVGVGLCVLAVSPVLMAISQGHLNTAVDQFRDRNCAGAIDSALASLEAVGARPQPFEILGYCDAALGQDELAIDAMQSAVDRDPQNWELHYGLAVVRAVAGRDPRRAALAARRLNPLSTAARRAERRFRGTTPAQWRRGARGAAILVD